MTTRIWTKPETQKVVKGLRAAGYSVPAKGKTSGFPGYKTNENYITEKGTKRPLFQALDSGNHYLVTYHPELLTEKDAE